jgi:hypothetical protein
MHIETGNPSVLAKVTHVSDVAHGPLVECGYDVDNSSQYSPLEVSVVELISTEETVGEMEGSCFILLFIENFI